VQATFEINYDYGTFDPVTDTVSLIFDNVVDSLQLYPYNACKSIQYKAGNGSPSQVSLTGITFKSAPVSKTVTLAFKQAVRDNTDVYTQSFNNGVQSDKLQLCVYAATLSGHIEIGYMEVQVLLNFSASGTATYIDVDVLNGPQNTVSSDSLRENESVSESTTMAQEDDDTSSLVAIIALVAAGVCLVGLITVGLTCACAKHCHHLCSDKVDDKCTVKSTDSRDSTTITYSSDAYRPLPAPSRTTPPCSASRTRGAESYCASESSRRLRRQIEQQQQHGNNLLRVPATRAKSERLYSSGPGHIARPIRRAVSEQNAMILHAVQWNPCVQRVGLACCSLASGGMVSSSLDTATTLNGYFVNTQSLQPNPILILILQGREMNMCLQSWRLLHSTFSQTVPLVIQHLLKHKPSILYLQLHHLSCTEEMFQPICHGLICSATMSTVRFASCTFSVLASIDFVCIKCCCSFPPTSRRPLRDSLSGMRPNPSLTTLERMEKELNSRLSSLSLVHYSVQPGGVVWIALTSETFIQKRAMPVSAEQPTSDESPGDRALRSEAKL